MTPPYNLKNIQALRWLAALLVFVQHAVYFSGQINNDSIQEFLRLSFGSIGVFVFFIISGFVIALQTDKKPSLFAAHRLARIYPAFFIAAIVASLIFFLFSNYRPVLNSGTLSMLLIPVGSLNGTFQIPYWTLIYEVFFYALVLLAMIAFKARPQLLNIAMFAWLLVILGFSNAGIKTSVAMPTLSEIVISTLNIYFIVGFFLSRLLFSPTSRIAYAALFAMALEAVYFPELRYTAIICTMGAIAILSLVRLPALPAFLIKLGDYSYGIYLMHMPVIFCLFLALKPHGVDFYTSIAIMTVIALPAAILFGKFEYWFYQTKIRPAVDKFLTRPNPLHQNQPLEQP
ncbi:acyltransferase family protein [Pseudomonas sp. TNT2022 ID642]|uniref:acyltransferase family protein n=1 Tax=Pseudomonas sp. TNT2022 ID642 TaxID=2942632 RepID=UPI00235DE84E|nr:acyltransferase [Pseudomonas sp. TNT2022 ID642]MDD1005320.1 acyltransferase [Pseudomonas sp. TNT2022 ID642]